jgi:hypothetical protein
MRWKGEDASTAQRSGGLKPALRPKTHPLLIANNPPGTLTGFVTSFQ